MIDAACSSNNDQKECWTTTSVAASMCVQLTGNFDSSEEQKMIVMGVNPSIGTDLDSLCPFYNLSVIKGRVFLG